MLFDLLTNSHYDDRMVSLFCDATTPILYEHSMWLEYESMWLEYESDSVVSQWALLNEVCSVDHAEADLFRQQSSVIDQAGCWGRFLLKLTNRQDDEEPTHNFGLSWRYGVTKLNAILKRGARCDPDGRAARWLEIINGRDRLVASFMPHVYSLGQNYWLDHRFVVGCTNTNIIPTVMLFSSVILGEDAWTGSQSSLSLGSMNI